MKLKPRRSCESGRSEEEDDERRVEPNEKHRQQNGLALNPEALIHAAHLVRHHHVTSAAPGLRAPPSDEVKRSFLT